MRVKNEMKMYALVRATNAPVHNVTGMVAIGRSNIIASRRTVC